MPESWLLLLLVPAAMALLSLFSDVEAVVEDDEAVELLYSATLFGGCEAVLGDGVDDEASLMSGTKETKLIKYCAKDRRGESISVIVVSVESERGIPHMTSEQKERGSRNTPNLRTNIDIRVEEGSRDGRYLVDVMYGISRASRRLRERR